MAWFVVRGSIIAAKNHFVYVLSAEIVKDYSTKP